MHCASCANRISRALNEQKGVEALVNFALNRARVRFDESISINDLTQIIENTGFSASLYNPFDFQKEEEHLKKIARQEKRHVLGACLFTLPFLVQMLLMWGGNHATLPPFVQFILASVVQFFFGFQFYKGAWSALKNKSANMDCLVVLGSSVAWGFSTLVFLFQLNAHLYFEGAAMVIALVLLGKFLENRAKEKTNAALKALIHLQPPMARLKTPEGIKEIRADLLMAGDVLEVLEGESPPADGVLLEGKASLNESMLTGESAFVVKETGDSIFLGTQNVGNAFLMRAEKVGSDSLLSHIIKEVENAQSSRAAVQNWADKIANIFVPLICLFALFTFFAWLGAGNVEAAFINSVCVLVVACPCALGLATPAALVVGVGQGAKFGILIKNAQSLENAAQLNKIALDKTGTLTEALPKVSTFHLFSGEENSIFKMVYSIEKSINHPLAKAIAQFCKEKNNFHGEPPLFFENIQNQIGEGVFAQVNESQYFLGAPKNTQIPFFETALEKGESVVAFYENEVLLAGFALKDPLRNSAQNALNRLKQQGVEVVMLTGDFERVAQNLAQSLNIPFYARLKPIDKAQMIEQWQKNGEIVGMAGDGINDSVALSRANVGFAMGKAAFIAQESADITLINNDLNALSDSIDLSRAVLGKIKQNLFFAFFYNLFAVLLAAFGFLTPAIAGAAMALSSISVLMNALSLKYWQPRSTG